MPNTHATLTSLFSDIADAIRAKDGTSASIVADNFPTAIANIPSGSTTISPLSVTSNGTYTAPSGTAYSPVTVNVSGGGSVDAGVQFIDYDGSIVETWTASEVVGKTALPSNPSHTGLTAQGWNWSLANIKAYIADYPDALMTVGQMYTTTSGASELDCTFTADTLHPYLGITLNGTVEVDWGDNSATSTLTGTSLATIKWADHEYAAAGNYTIKLTVQNGSFAFYCTSSSYGAVLSYTNAFNYSRKYSICIKAIRIGASASIGNNAFLNCYSAQSITIPDGVTSIGTYAFSYCYSAQSITIPDSVTSIGTYAFSYCYSAQSITIPDSVTSVGTNAFQNCYAAQSITIPESVTSIGNNAFQNCYVAQPITIPESVTSIGSNAFQGCYVAQSITIPDGVTSIESGAFQNCYAARSITIPDGVTSIGNNAFYNCYVAQPITIPDGVTSIGTYAFYNCYSAQSITIPDSITSIGNNAFLNCYSAQSITIPDGVTSIGTYAFSNCYSAQSITIPDGVTSIGNNAFSNCYSAGAVYLYPTTPPTLANTNAFSGIRSACVIYVPYSADHSILEAYQTATNWSTYAGRMQEMSA